MPNEREADNADLPAKPMKGKYDGFSGPITIKGLEFFNTQFNSGATTMNSGTWTISLFTTPVCLDSEGLPKFNNLLFRRGSPSFVAFDLLFLNGKDQRHERLIDRKLELKRVLGQVASPLMYADHVEGAGMALFAKACELDLEGIVAKHKHSPYAPEAETTWFKIRNRSYSQWAGGHELFERERHQEPVAGWHACTLAAGQ